MKKQHRREMREQREKAKGLEKIDLTPTDEISNCCSASIYEPDICAECKEHCDPVCAECEGTGETYIPAQQVAGQIVDEITQDCICRIKVEDEMDDDS